MGLINKLEIVIRDGSRKKWWEERKWIPECILLSDLFLFFLTSKQLFVLHNGSAGRPARVLRFLWWPTLWTFRVLLPIQSMELSSIRIDCKGRFGKRSLKKIDSTPTVGFLFRLKFKMAARNHAFSPCGKFVEFSIRFMTCGGDFLFQMWFN